jgi:hypothetical protein
MKNKRSAQIPCRLPFLPVAFHPSAQECDAAKLHACNAVGSKKITA